MSEHIDTAGAAAVLTRLDAAVDDLLDLSLTGCSHDDVLAVWQRLETVRCRLAAADHAVIAEVQSRHLDFTHGARSVAAFARQLLRIGIGEAHARVVAAAAAGPRTSMTGEQLAPIYPEVAAAQAAGSISPAHARVITGCIDKLPDDLQAEHARAAAGLLVDQSRTFDPDTLAKLARRLSDTLNPDGLLDDAAYRQRHRDLHTSQRPDGSGRITGELTAQTMEHLLTMLDAFGRPAPEHDGQKDPRTPGQRRHDALLDALKSLERADQLPNTGGLTATVILTTSHAEWDTGTGSVLTGHGARVPTRDAKTWIDGETRIIAVALDRRKAITGYGSSHRIFTENQRLALTARDLGCSFPGCDTPPNRCESHHIRQHSANGPTNTTNGTLICGYHHREHQRMGWTATTINDVPHWIPPPWIDPTQQPRRNHMHNAAAELLGV